MYRAVVTIIASFSNDPMPTRTFTMSKLVTEKECTNPDDADMCRYVANQRAAEIFASIESLMRDQVHAYSLSGSDGSMTCLDPTKIISINVRADVEEIRQ